MDLTGVFFTYWYQLLGHFMRSEAHFPLNFFHKEFRKNAPIR